MQHHRQCLFVLFVWIISECSSLIANKNYAPRGTSPLLYRPGSDPIIQLDYYTFEDTIFGQNHAFVVEFYADWCGHCRAFAPHFREFAAGVGSWNSIVSVAAINCADPLNQNLCMEQNIFGYPLIKYYPRNARQASDAITLDLPEHSAASLRTLVVRAVLNEYNKFHYSDWPQLSHLLVSGYRVTPGDSGCCSWILSEYVYDWTQREDNKPLRTNRYSINSSTFPRASSSQYKNLPHEEELIGGLPAVLLVRECEVKVVKSTYGDLWIGVQPSANYLAILFEQFDSVGGPFLLDLWPFRNHVGARRALATSPLVSMLRIRRFPHVTVFTRSQQQAVYMKPFTAHSVEEIRLLASSAPPSTQTTTTPHPVIVTTHIPIINCNVYPQRCRAMYYVSETDMLKAMRIALLDEVVKTSNRISNENFTALFNFVDLLAQHFPIYTFSNGLPKEHRRSRRAPLLLKSSNKARHIFMHMREFLRAHKREMSVSSAAWHHQFINIERVYGRPFAQNASWEHCKGSTPQLRGYTCGLWTTFHALTVNVYLDAKDEEQDPLKPLKAIKGWVSSFFGCLHCRRHFHHMTSKLFPMNERRIRQASDAMMYLWRAHNIVNRRLHTDLTEDPQFEKRQFPAPFLCPTCQVDNEHFSRKEVRRFLLHYYGNIRAHNSSEEQRISATLSAQSQVRL